MSFTVGMPESGSSLGNTRLKFVNELAGIRSTMSANHIDQNDTGAGKHTFCQFKSVSVGATSATELALYNKITSAQRFFMRQPNSGAEIQMSGVTPVNAADGYTFLPGGLLLQWGIKSAIPSTTAIDVTFPIAFDSAPYSITTQPTLAQLNQVASSNITATTSTKFTIRMATSTFSFGIGGFPVSLYWMAIGTKA